MSFSASPHLPSPTGPPFPPPPPLPPNYCIIGFESCFKSKLSNLGNLKIEDYIEKGKKRRFWMYIGLLACVSIMLECFRSYYHNLFHSLLNLRRLMYMFGLVYGSGYVMGEVVLGLPGPWAVDKREASDHYTTKIGGLPDWKVPDSAFGLLSCSVCRNNLCLVAQVYAPVSSKDLNIEERLILVFGCVMPKCGSSPESWRVLRVQKSSNNDKSNTDSVVVVSPTATPLAVPSSGQADLGTSDSRQDNGEEDKDIDLKELGRALSEAARIAAKPKKQQKKKKNKSNYALNASKIMGAIDIRRPVLRCFYIYVQKDAFSRASTALCSSLTSLSIEEASDQTPEETWEEEGYEYDRALNADRTYLKFKKRLDVYPEQCFRYSYGGKPLMATTQVVDPGVCRHCGGSRHYEMQLMPPLLYFLQEALDSEEYSVEDWDWMTLLIYTCSASCSKSDEEISVTNGWTVVEEAVIVQNE